MVILLYQALGFLPGLSTLKNALKPKQSPQKTISEFPDVEDMLFVPKASLHDPFPKPRVPIITIPESLSPNFGCCRVCKPTTSTVAVTDSTFCCPVCPFMSKLPNAETFYQASKYPIKTTPSLSTDYERELQILIDPEAPKHRSRGKGYKPPCCSICKRTGSPLGCCSVCTRDKAAHRNYLITKEMMSRSTGGVPPLED